MSTGPIEPYDEMPDEMPEGSNPNGDVDPVNFNFDPTPPESLDPDGVSSGDEKVKTGLDDLDLAEIKIDADKVVVDGKDADGDAGVKGLEDEPPAPARETPANSSSPIGSGFQGPLSVDNVGDYLDDKSEELAAIDEASRERALAEFIAAEDDKAEAKEAEDRERNRNANAREFRKEKQLAKRAQDFIENNPGAELPEAFHALQRDDDGNFLDRRGDPISHSVFNDANFDEEDPDEEDDDDADGGAMRIPGDADIADKRQSVVPNIGPGTPAHVESQRSVDMSDFGQQGPSHYQLQGQSESAVQESIELSSDAIKTVSAAVVDTLKELASVLNQHHDAIQTLRDIVASSGEEDVR